MGLSEYSIRAHAEWLALGANPDDRRARYTELVEQRMSDEELETFRRCARKGLPTGSKHFKAEVEKALAKRIGDGRRGRPKKGL
jgi:hypothetical protein